MAQSFEEALNELIETYTGAATDRKDMVDEIMTALEHQVALLRAELDAEESEEDDEAENDNEDDDRKA